MNITARVGTRDYSRTSQIRFGMNIIDMHTHIGKHQNHTYTKSELDVFVKQSLPNNDNVEMMIVSDTDTFKGVGLNEYEGNKKALESFNGDKSYLFMASCAPHKGDVKFIKQVIQEFPNKFVGLKFHPNDAQLPVTDEKYKPYFEYANENKLPCIFHCHVNVDKNGKVFRLADGSVDLSKADRYSDPELIYQMGRQYKDAPFIMAHLGAGWNESHDRAIDILVESVKKGDANLYADVSWVDIDAPKLPDGRSPKDHIVKAIKKLKGIGDPTWDKGDQSFRLMFGTDAPIARFCEGSARDSYSKFVEEIKTAIKLDKDLANDAEKIIQDLFYNNAKKLFSIDNLKDNASKIVSETKKSGGNAKIIGGVAAAIAVISGGAIALKSKNSDKNSSCQK